MDFSTFRQVCIFLDGFSSDLHGKTRRREKLQSSLQIKLLQRNTSDAGNKSCEVVNLKIDLATVEDVFGGERREIT